MNYQLPKVGLLLALAAVWIGFALAPKPALAATLPATTCTATGPTSRTCDLWAKSTTINLTGTVNATVWGYSDSAAGTPTLPGPLLIVNQGDSVTVHLTNLLPETTALSFLGQSMRPDRVGVATNGTKSYQFVASNPGTFLYEAGLLSNAQHQVAMGLAGVLIVRPAAANQAYANANSAFDDEAIVFLNEVDLLLNNSANPANFDMRNYAPHYRLINGKLHPNTDLIETSTGKRVLLRYVNAGLQFHSMSVIGVRQSLLAMDGATLARSRRTIAQTLSPGQTMDVIATIPAPLTQDSLFPLYDANLILNNNGVNGLGGMLTMLHVHIGDLLPPLISNVQLTPVGNDLRLTALVDDSTTGNSNIVAGEYYLDSTAGTANPMVAADGAFNSPTETISATITAATLDGLSTGSHTIYVRGQDAALNWSIFATVTFSIDNTGPTTSNFAAVPNPTNGSSNVSLTASADDSASGNNAIVAGEYFIDGFTTNGAGIAMSVSGSTPVESLSATILASTITGLSEGEHVLSAHAQDAAGNWGATTSLTLLVDRTGPNTSDVTIAPNPNNGTLPISSTEPSVLVNATLDDTPPIVGAGLFGADATNRVFLPIVAGGNSNVTSLLVQTADVVPGTHYVAQAELFIDTPGTDGAGIPMLASDGLFDTAVEAVYVYVPLTTINALSEGNHPFYVHGMDGAGNWGEVISGTLRIDKTAPTITGLTLTPNPTNGSATVTVTAVASDTASVVTDAEWFINNDPGIGSATVMSVTANGIDWDLAAQINVALTANGTYTVNVRAKDAAGNWSSVVTTTLTVASSPFQPGDVTGDGFINIFDLQALINMIQSELQPDATVHSLDWWQRADLFPDNSWNVIDLQILLNLIQANG